MCILRPVNGWEAGCSVSAHRLPQGESLPESRFPHLSPRPQRPPLHRPNPGPALWHICCMGGSHSDSCDSCHFLTIKWNFASIYVHLPSNRARALESCRKLTTYLRYPVKYYLLILDYLVTTSFRSSKSYLMY